MPEPQANMIEKLHIPLDLTFGRCKYEQKKLNETAFLYL